MSIMLYIPTKTKLLIIILGIGVIVMLAISIAVNFSSPEDSQPLLPPTGVPIISQEFNPQTEPTFKNYLTVKLGDPSDTLSQLPDLMNRSDLPVGKVKYEFLSTYPGINNLIITQNQKVAFKSNITISSNDYKTPLIDSYLRNYGNPEVEFTGSARYGRFAKTYIYPNQGFALIFNPATKEVYEVQSFSPTSIDEYIRNWGSDLKDYSKESPLPEI